jgi:hypothetical protein
MEKVITLLEDALDVILHETKIPAHYQEVDYIKQALAELKTPRWRTPEQWEAETGKPWPDDWPVWYISDEEEPKWRGGSYRKAKKIDRVNDTLIICATFDGPLPPDDWMPEK